MKHEVINKFVVPTRYHFAKKGTVARVITDYEKSYYIQLGDDEIKPNWIPMALVLEKAFETQFATSKFIDAIINLYEQATGKDIQKLDMAIEDLITHPNCDD